MIKTIPKANTGFSQYSDPGLQVKTQTIINAITGNPNFPAPHDELDATVTSYNSYTQSLLAAKTGDRTAILIKNSAKKNLVDCLKNLGDWVNFIAKGDASILSSSAFTISRDPEAAPEVTKPDIILLENGMNPGELNVKIGKVAGARSYIYQYTTTDPTLQTSEWVSLMCTVTKLQFKNLESGKRYWCRVAAVGSKEQVVYGDPVSRITQ